MSVLVTGATGFVGWSIPSLLLDRGHDVHVVCRFPDRIDWPERVRRMCTIHVADLTVEGEPSRIVDAARPTHLIHLAWYAQPGKFWSSPLNLDWAAASLRLFTAFAEAGGKRFVGCGTCAEYDWNYHVFSEVLTPLRPATLYGTAKVSLFRMLSDAARQGGPTFVWGRMFFPYGPRENAGRLLPDVIAALLAGREVAVSEGRQVRDFIYVDDVARAFVQLMESDVTGPVNIASGTGTSVRTLVEAAAARINRPELVRFGARPSQPGEPPYLVADVSLLREGLGYSGTVDLDEGLDRTIAWWKNRLARVGERP